MYVHLGGDTIVRRKELVGIFHTRVTLAGATKEFLNRAREQDHVADLAGGQPKALVVMRERVFLSPISPGALKRRAGQLT